MSTDSVAQDLIRSFFERWERLETEKDAISGDLKELFAEAKGNGFDTKVLRKLFRDQRADATERQEFEALYDLYAAALNAPRVRDARDAREDDEEFDPETGEIKSTQHQSSETAGAVPNKASIGANAGGENVAPSGSNDREKPSAEMGNGPGASAGSVDFDGKSRDGGPAPISDVEPVAPHSEPAEGNTPTSAGHGDESATHAAALVVADNVVPIKKRLTFNDPAHADCLDPVRCGGFSNLKLCQRCSEAAEQGQVA